MQSEQKKVLRNYFRSIEEPFRETLAVRRRFDWIQALALASVMITIFCLLPVVPYAASRLATWLGADKFAVYGHLFSLTFLKFWWPASVASGVAASAMLINWDIRNDEAEARTLLSDPIMRFALCFSIVYQLGEFETNRIQKHVDDAVDTWTVLRKKLPLMLRPFPLLSVQMQGLKINPDNDNVWVQGDRFAIYPEIDTLKAQFEWFRLSEQTESIVAGFETLPTKVQDRLKDKKDTSDVKECLLELAGYLYSRIPELSGTGDGASLTEFGSISLSFFCERLSKMTEYKAETKPDRVRWRLSKTLKNGSSKVTVLFQHPNVFACFLSWYVLSALLTLTVLSIVLHYFHIGVDSAIVVLLVGAPLAAGVSAVALARPRQPGVASDSTLRDRVGRDV